MFLGGQIKASSESVLKKVLHQVGLPDTMQQQNSLNLSHICSTRCTNLQLQQNC
jgi:hypothetical protein